MYDEYVVETESIPALGAGGVISVAGAPRDAYVFLDGARGGGMDTTFAVGAALTAAGLLGYAVGVVAAYPGRAFAVTGFMVGVTLLAVAGGEGE